MCISCTILLLGFGLNQTLPCCSFCLFQGRYVLANGTVNIDAVARMAGSQMTTLMDRIWMPEIQVFNEKNELHVCFKVTGSFTRTRSQ